VNCRTALLLFAHCPGACWLIRLQSLAADLLLSRTGSFDRRVLTGSFLLQTLTGSFVELRKHLVEHDDNRRPKKNDKESRKHEKYQRWNHFYAGLGRHFFGALAALGAERIGVNAKRLRQVSSEAIGLNEHADERFDVVNTGAIRQFLKGLEAAPADAHFKIDEMKFVAEFGVCVFELIGDASDGLVETQAALNANHEQVESVGKSQHHPELTMAHSPAEPHVWEQKTEDCSAEQDWNWAVRIPAGEINDSQEKERQKYFGAAQDGDEFGPAVTGANHQAVELGHFAR